MAVAPWPMTTGRLRGRTQAETMPALPINAHLIFDHRDDWNYKFAGLQMSSGRWVIGAVHGGAETIPSTALRAGLASATATPPQADRWYTLDLVVGLNQVTLYADGTDQVTWTRAAGQVISGGRVGMRWAQRASGVWITKVGARPVAS